MADDQDTNTQKQEEVQEAVEEAEEAKGAQSDAASQLSEPKEQPEQETEVAASPTESAEEATPATSEKKKPVSKELEKISAPLSNSLKGIIESIEKLSVLELADLVHSLEDRFGVTAQAPMAVAGATPAAAGEPEAEQTTFNVILTSAGANKIGAIKAVRELVPTLGLKEAKDLVEAAPKPVMEGVNKETANEAKTKLTAAGASVELQ